MLNGRTIIKIIALVLAELIILTLLLTGTLIFPSTKVKNLVEENSITTPKIINQVITSNNYIYASYIDIKDYHYLNITKYNSNLQQIWSFSYNYANIFPNSSPGYIISATDQNVLLSFSEIKNFNDHFYYLIVNNNGVQAKFNITQLEQLNGFPGYLGSVLPLGANYILTYLKYNQNYTEIEGLSLNNDNTTNTLFKTQFNNKSYVLMDTFYSNSQNVEIPFYSEKMNQSKLLGFDVINSYFLEYNIIQHSLVKRNSNYAKIFGEVNDLQSTTNDLVFNPDIFNYNKNYLGLVIHLTPQNLRFEIWGNSGILAKYYVSGLYSESDFGNRANRIGFFPEPVFQINNRVFINLLYLGYNTIPRKSIPVLLIYTKYTFHSTLGRFNYTDLFYRNDSNQTFTGFATHLSDNVVYYGDIYKSASDITYFIKIYHSITSILDFIYSLPILLKFLIGLIYLAPSAYYIIRKYRSITTSSEIYPIN